ncbi:hypothetical protein HanRHA438_Chr13g0597151 [Helianthus annuus]|nr:hypothetical protein HanIR_Chr13g0638651 [Helianthus annuus]KAJ0858073.1 hypothetical protein HanRHA438_Chr13g0597151 [Helianthus annuus]
MRLQCETVDFGWGKPHFGSYYFSWVGKLDIYANDKCNQQWGLDCLYASSSKAFGFGQTMGSEVFKPLTPTYFHF